MGKGKAKGEAAWDANETAGSDRYDTTSSIGCQEERISVGSRAARSEMNDTGEVCGWVGGEFVPAQCVQCARSCFDFEAPKGTAMRRACTQRALLYKRLGGSGIDLSASPQMGPFPS